MSNFALEVRARSKASFVRALAIACAAAPGNKVSHWCESKKYGLVLFWAATDDARFHQEVIHPFPCDMDPAEIAEFAWQWLQKVDRKKFTLDSGWDHHYDGGDVDNEPAYRIFVEDWGHVGGSTYGVAAILPVWAWLGK